MSLTAAEEEDLRRLQTKFGGMGGREVDTEQDFAALEAKFGSISPPQAASPAESAGTPSSWDQTKHIAKGFGQAGVDVIDTVRNVQDAVWGGVEAVTGY